MFIFDSQVHVWPPGSGATLEGWPHRVPPLGYRELVELMDEAGVDRVALVPPRQEGDDPSEALNACADYPGRFCVFARPPLERPDEARAMLAHWRTIADIRGIRLSFLTAAEQALLAAGALDWYWAYAEDFAVPTMALVVRDKHLVAAAADRHPGLKLSLSHLGVPLTLRDDAIAQPIAETCALARHPNISVKLSAAPALSTAPYPFDNLRSYLERIVGAFGPARCFWGTDLSRLLDRMSYADAVTHFTEHLDFPDEPALDAIMGRAFGDWVGWPAASRGRRPGDGSY